MSHTVSFTYKIQVPRRPDHLVSRPRLLHSLNAIVERQLVIISAPIGYGKTSLLIDFANSQPILPICWLSLSSFDQDPWEFLGYLTATVEQRFPNSVARTQRMLNSRGQNEFTTVGTTLAHEIDAIRSNFAIIIDDWHLVDHVCEINALINTLLQLCSNCHLILASRTSPTLANLMLLMARRQLVGIGEQNLRLTLDEATTILGSNPDDDQQRAQIAQKLNQTQGWITGLLLTQMSSAVMPPSNSHQQIDRHIHNLLVEQVFNLQPPDIRAFLLDSALLDELTASTCDLILHRNDSAALLNLLVQHQLFISEIAPGTYQYHTMFREFLRAHYRLIDPGRLQQTAARVVADHMDRQRWSQAFDVCVAAHDLAMAVQVAQSGGEQMYAVNRVETLERWFATLPNEMLDATLLCLKARVLLNRGKPHDARGIIALAEKRAQPHQRIDVLIVRAQIARILGQYQQALSDIESALQLGPSRLQLGALLRLQATCHHRLGQTGRAITELDQALEIEREHHDLYAMARIQHDLGICYEAKGMLQHAEDYYSHADALLATLGNTGQRAMSLNSKAVVQHLSGRYHDALATLTTALGFANDAALPRARATVLASLGDLYTDMRRWSEAQDTYADAETSGGSAFLNSYIALMQIRLLAHQGHYAKAERALKRLPQTVLDQQPHLTLFLRTLLAIGLGQTAEAIAGATQAVNTFLGAGSPLDLARAYLLRAATATIAQPPAHDQVLHWVEQALQISDSLGHDTFLAAEAGAIPPLREYPAKGSSRASLWLQALQSPQQPPAPDAPASSAPKITLQPAPLPVLTIRTLGADQILVDGARVDIGWLKAREVLYYLIAQPDGASSDALCDAIWGDAEIDKARDALRSAIYRLRSALPRQFITRHGRHTYRLDHSAFRLSYDVASFLAIVEGPKTDNHALSEAISLYRGPYLIWSSNEWCTATRTYLEQQYLQGLCILAKHHENAQAHQKAIPLYMRILAINEFDEDAHTSIMRCHIALQNRAAAIEQYQTLQRILRAELGLDVVATSEASRLYEQLLDG